MIRAHPRIIKLSFNEKVPWNSSLAPQPAGRYTPNSKGSAPRASFERRVAVDSPSEVEEATQPPHTLGVLPCDEVLRPPRELAPARRSSCECSCEAIYEWTHAVGA